MAFFHSIPTLFYISVCLSLSFTLWLRTGKKLVMISSQECRYHLCGFFRIFLIEEEVCKVLSREISSKHPYNKGSWTFSSLSTWSTFYSSATKKYCLHRIKIMVSIWSLISFTVCTCRSIILIITNSLILHQNQSEHWQGSAQSHSPGATTPRRPFTTNAQNNL